ncbi:hypothetical protein M8Z33_32915 [Streptomyces sp. ZAF1911]|uniref:hypothetical protein n=1 Tax=Streptomyces sp. ZAF1911 TaxID=2944129 RepID=UPI00237B9E27|nr:hypothetical protein [Streptomyces sp. ZAF1911]MDD9381371.1 hypothetical protein [Streptomyces sp. ZAF1911]
MEHDAPLVREVFPELASELVKLLDAEGEHALALCAHDLRIVADCGCGDDFCQSFRTHPHPPGTPYGPGHRTVPLLPERGMLIVDAVDGRIVYVEILDRPPMRRASPEPAGRAEEQHADL